MTDPMMGARNLPKFLTQDGSFRSRTRELQSAITDAVSHGAIPPGQRVFGATQTEPSNAVAMPPPNQGPVPMGEIPTFEQALMYEITRIFRTLISKREGYGGSIFKDFAVFSDFSTRQKIFSRLDDKLSRIKNGNFHGQGEDTIDDIIGYLFLLLLDMHGWTE